MGNLFKGINQRVTWGLIGFMAGIVFSLAFGRFLSFLLLLGAAFYLFGWPLVKDRLGSTRKKY